MQEPSPRVEELRQSAEQLARQALETAELGIRLVRNQIETAAGQQPPQVADLQRNLQDTALTAETKAKELFTLATRFMNELNDKWQPGSQGPEAKAPEASKPERVHIDID